MGGGNRTGLNSKMNDLEASIGLEGIKHFHKTFDFRYDKMKWFRETAKRATWPVPEPLYYSEEDEGNTNCPHGFSFVGKRAGDIQVMIDSLDKHNIHWKRNFGCIPTQHQAFADMEYSLGDFPESEWVGDNGIHIRGGRSGEIAYMVDGIMVEDALLGGMGSDNQGPYIYRALDRPNIDFYNEDIRLWSNNLKYAIQDSEIIIPLAAIVGAPICDKMWRDSEEINYSWFEDLLNIVDNQLIF